MDYLSENEFFVAFDDLSDDLKSFFFSAVSIVDDVA